MSGDSGPDRSGEIDRIRVMTWNVWWRFGGNWREREQGIIAVARDVDPDVLGIQECWTDGDESQADVIAGALGGRHAAFVQVDLPAAPSPPEDETQRGAIMGLGLVSRWPILSAESVAVPSAGRENCALVATIERPNGELRVVVGATSWEPERVEETAVQFAELQRLTRDGHSQRPNPSILLADLNYDLTQPALAGRHLEDAWESADFDADPRTLSSTNRFAPVEATDQYDRRIDHVLYLPGSLGAVATDARIIRDEPGGLPPSDHYPVVADIGVGVGPVAEVLQNQSASWMR
jgi:endonuclease/exonuclease/phosphatase family metal-dependent hydrolase